MTYAYDLAGRHVREKTVAMDAARNTTVAMQNNFIRYDQLGRMTQVWFNK